MQLPFTSDQFNGVFRDYNDAVWPVQLLLSALAVLALGLALRPRRWSGAAASGILAFFWVWIAAVYHLAFFSFINPAAYLFAAVSAAGAGVFVWQGVFRRRLRFGWTGGPRSYIGAALIAFALVVYPAWSSLTGHTYPALATFGLPCPTTLFTVGLLAFAVPPYPRSPLLVPVLWCFVGAQAAFVLDVAPDLGLIPAAVIGVGLMFRSKALPAPGKASVRVDAQAATRWVR